MTVEPGKRGAEPERTARRPPPLEALGENWPRAESPAAAPEAEGPPNPARRGPGRRRRGRRARRWSSPRHRRNRWAVVAAACLASGFAVGAVAWQGGSSVGVADLPPDVTSVMAPPGPAAPVPAGHRVGGEVVDRAAFAAGPATAYTPATAVTAADRELVGALYDGLSDVVPTDALARPRPVVAEGWQVTGDRTWTFQLRPGLRFSDGSPVLASSFADAWDAAASPANTAPDAELFRLVSGGEERRSGEADHIEGVAYDDDTGWLEVTLTGPFPDFPALVAHPIFSPVAADGVTGNGPFVLEGPAGADGTVALQPNPEWSGAHYDGELRLPARPFLDRLVFAAPGDTTSVGTEVTLLDAGTPASDAAARPGVLTSYYLSFDGDDPAVGGVDGLLLRQAVIQAVDRERIAREAFGPAWAAAASLTPPPMPGYEVGTCRYCVAPEDGFAGRAYGEWLDSGASLASPLRVGSSDRPAEARAAMIVVENLEAVGIPAERVIVPAGTVDPTAVGSGCQLCLRRAEPAVATYESILGPALAGEAWAPPGMPAAGTSEAQAELEHAREAAEAEQRRALYRIAEASALDEASVVPLVWGSSDRAYDPALFADVPVYLTGAVAWERVALAG